MNGNSGSTANTATSNAAAKNGTGWYRWSPGTSSTTVLTTLPTTPSRGWIVDPAGGSAYIPAGTWDFTVKTDIPYATFVSGSAVLTVGVWKGTISGGTFVPTTTVLTPTDDPAGQNLRASVLPTTTTAQFSIGSVSLDPGETLYVEFWRHQTTGINSNAAAARQLDFYAETGDTYITHPAAQPREPVNVEHPRIEGMGNQGTLLTADHGTWNNNPTSYSYQWRRCDSSYINCTFISGETDATYQASQADVNGSVRVRVTASNQYGSTYADSPGMIILDSIDTFASAFRPALYFDEDEPWRPVSVDSFFANEYADGSPHRLCVRAFRWVEPSSCNASAPDIQDETVLDSVSASDIAYVDVFGDAANGADRETTEDYPSCKTDNGFGTILKDCNTDPASVIYYDASQGNDGYRYLDYWAFYRYNDVLDSLATGNTGDKDDHEGDWEGMAIMLDPQGVAQGWSIPQAVFGVIFGQHSKLTWVLSDALSYDYLEGNARGHVMGYVARGTHATYPDACFGGGFYDDCPSPENDFFLGEAHHGGEAQWGENYDYICEGYDCVQSFGSWVNWPHQWGADVRDQDVWDAIGKSVGDSPTSPGTQTRYACNQSAWTCPEGPFASTADSQPATQESTRSLNPRYCASWFGAGISVAACDEKVLKRTLRLHQGNRKGSLRILVAGHKSAAIPGLAQVLPPRLHVGEKIILRGRPTPNMSLSVRVQIGRKERVLRIGKLRFKGTKAVLRVSRRNGAPSLVWLSR